MPPRLNAADEVLREIPPGRADAIVHGIISLQMSINVKRPSVIRTEE